MAESASTGRLPGTGFGLWVAFVGIMLALIAMGTARLRQRLRDKKANQQKGSE
jgi:hypothetical protein